MLVEAVVMAAGRAAATLAEVGREAAPAAAAATAVSEARQLGAARVSEQRASKPAAASGRAGLSAFSLTAALRSRGRLLRFFEVTGQNFVH